MTHPGGLPVRIRPAAPADREAVLELLAASLGWSVDDTFRAYLHWKHDRSPLGPSPAWVAVHDGAVVGYRAMLRWDLEGPGRRRIVAARAVDVATHPSVQGQGVFSALTAHAIESLRAAGVELIFTTPNAKAGAGWVKAGAQLVGRLPTMVRPGSLRGLGRMLRAGGSAGRWPVPTAAGSSAAVTTNDPRLRTLLTSLAPATGVRTYRTPELLRWRYGYEPLGYRTIAVDDDPARGLAVFRLRRRGGATEAALCEVLTPADEPGAAARLRRSVAHASGADYVITLGSGRWVERGGSVVVPGQGPTLYAMALVPGLDVSGSHRWDLALGDVELL